MTIRYLALALGFCGVAMAQTAGGAKADPFRTLAFLEGTWNANVDNNGAVTLSGKYVFMRELDGHVLARHSSSDPNCSAPASFDCKHGDLLYVFQEAPGASLKAIYFDNEGHTIRYNVSAPSQTSVVFLSEPGGGPQFRLTYDLSGGVMRGKFQMQIPGQSDWKTYLEWSGKRI